MSNFKVQTIRHTGIIATDMDKALEFYCDLLGLEVLIDVQQDSEWLEKLTAYPGKRRVVMLEAPDGNRIEIFQFYDHPKEAPKKVETGDIGCSHVCFRVDDVEAAYKELRAAGVECNSEPLVSPDGFARVMYCHDFDGTIVEMTQILKTDIDPYKS